MDPFFVSEARRIFSEAVGAVQVDGLSTAEFNERALRLVRSSKLVLRQEKEGRSVDDLLLEEGVPAEIISRACEVAREKMEL